MKMPFPLRSRELLPGGDNKGDFMYQKVIIYERSQDYEAAYEAVQEYCELFPNDEDAQKERTFLSTRI